MKGLRGSEVHLLQIYCRYWSSQNQLLHDWAL